MDKLRLALALLLTAAVVILTQVLFPPAKRPARQTASAAGGTTAAVPPGASARSVSTPQGGAPVTRSPVATPTTTAPAQPVPPAPTLAHADTVAAATADTRWRWSTAGAAPIALDLRQYRSLNPREPGSVQLVPPRQAMLGFRLVAGADTIALDTIAFTATRAGSPGGEQTVRFDAPVAGGMVHIEYTIPRTGYLARVQGTVQGIPGASALLLRLPDGLRTAEADTLDDIRHLAYAYKPRRDDPSGIAFAKLDTAEARVAAGPLTWVAARDKYFVIALLADSAQTPFSALSMQGVPHTGKTPRTAHAVAPLPLRNGSFAFELYAGPQEWRSLRAVGYDLDNVNPYAGFFHPIVQPFMTIVMRVLLWLKSATHLNYGWVLILLGIGIRLLLWPLYQSSMRSSLKMQQVQPQLAEIQKRYKNEPEKQRAELMKVYQAHGMSPFSPLAGCLPMLLPMPILFALYFVFESTIELRGVPFLWMPDLSLRDPLYILPLAMGVSMFALSWVGLKAAPQNPQAKMMSYAMPVMMTVLFLRFPAGLNLYYAVQNMAALPQQWVIARERAKFSPPPSPPAPPASPRPGRARAPARG